MRWTYWVWMAAGVIMAGGCADRPPRADAAHGRILEELDRAATRRAPESAPEAVSRALVPPLVVELPKAEGAAPEPRFDLSVNDAPASQVFLAIVSGTRYSMVVHPDVKGSISVNLKNVTVTEALDTLRDLYGYEYSVKGNRITVQPVALQTRVFQVNYLQATRTGRSDVRVSSGSITDAPTAAPGTLGAPPVPGALTGAPTQRLTESTRVTTSSESNFWGDIQKSVSAIVGGGEGRSVIVNAQSGVIVVRAMPAELRSVQRFLESMQLIVARQVVLEAKIIEVTLRDAYAAGINWAGFRDGSSRVIGGVIRPDSQIGATGPLLTPTGRAPDGSPTGTLGAVTGPAAVLATAPEVAGGVFGLALQTAHFAALLSFLETQGTVNVLSSPRVATLNNQKAVLKVGTDDFFVTNVSTTSVSSGAGTTTTPTITVQPFFSGIALDVTPQIDDSDNIILHIHPQVSTVVERQKNVNLGSLGNFTLPLASSSINETDTIVRVRDGNIVAIGGLMRQESVTDNSQVPGIGDQPGIGALFRQRGSSNAKSELVILIKPTVVRSDRTWQQDIAEIRDRVRGLQPPAPPSTPQH